MSNGVNSASGNAFILPAELDDDRSISVIGRRANIICLLVVAAIVWSIFAPIDELVMANGEIIPTDQVTTLEHREGGIVDSIAVQEGQAVKAGDVIVEMNTISTNADFEQVNVQALSIALKLKSIEALISGAEPRFPHVTPEHQTLLEKERVAHTARQTLLDKELASLRTGSALKALEVSSLSRDIASLERQIVIERERHDSLQNLLRAGHVSRQEYLEAKSALERLLQSLEASEGRKNVAVLQVQEAERALDAKLAEDRKVLLDEQSALNSEYAQLDAQLSKQRDRAERLVVRSPIDGVVQELVTKTIGEVIGAGEPVARIVPAERKIVAEVHVDPYDIGHIAVGDDAEINISTFDPSIFGTAHGTISVLSPTTFLTERGEPYYKAVISLDNNFVGQDSQQRYLQTGMIVDAKIKTGSKSLMRYLLKPVLRSFDTSFSER